MNRRQAKKKYKKVYGHNPPTGAQQLYELNRIFHKTAENITSASRAMNDAMDAMTWSVLRMIEQHKAKAAPDTQVEVAMMLSKKRKDGKRRKRR